MPRIQSSIEPLESKIIFIFDRITQLFKNILWEISYETNLSPLQLQILFYLNDRKEELRKISSIADEFGLTKATVSDAVRVLLEKEFVRKVPMKSDKRVKIIHLTEKGLKLVEWGMSKRDKLALLGLTGLKGEDKEQLFLSLMKIVSSYQEAGILKGMRMCPSCKNFVFNAFPGTEKPHLCKLTGKRFRNLEIQVNCDESSFG